MFLTYYNTVLGMESTVESENQTIDLKSFVVEFPKVIQVTIFKCT